MSQQGKARIFDRAEQVAGSKSVYARNFLVGKPLQPIDHTILTRSGWHKYLQNAQEISDNSRQNRLFAACSTLKEQTMSDIKSKVISIIVDKLGVDEGEVKAEASFTNDLGADSLDTVELIMEFEKEFNIAIPDDQAEKIQTVGQAVEYVEGNAK